MANVPLGDKGVAGLRERAQRVLDGGTFKRHMIPESREELLDRMVTEFAAIREQALAGEGEQVPPRDKIFICGLCGQRGVLGDHLCAPQPSAPPTGEQGPFPRIVTWREVAKAIEKHKPDVAKRFSLAELTYIARDLSAPVPPDPPPSKESVEWALRWLANWSMPTTSSAVHDLAREMDAKRIPAPQPFAPPAGDEEAQAIVNKYWSSRGMSEHSSFSWEEDLVKAGRLAGMEEAAKIAYKMQEAAGKVLQKRHDDDASVQYDTAMEIVEAIRAMATQRKGESGE